MDGKNRRLLRVVLCTTRAHARTLATRTSWWIDITGNQIDLKRQWFIKRNGAYNMLWTTGNRLRPRPTHHRRRAARGGQRRKGCDGGEEKSYGKGRSEARKKKKKTLDAIPSGFTPWPPTMLPPPSETDRLSSASRPPPRHARTYTPAPYPRRRVVWRVYVAWDEYVCVCLCFENTLTSRFARFSIRSLIRFLSIRWSELRSPPPRCCYLYTVVVLLLLLL